MPDVPPNDPGRDFLVPLRVLLDWLEAVPEAARAEIAADLFQFLPRKFHSACSGLDYLANFRAELLAMPSDEFEAVGLAHMIASLLDALLDGKDGDNWWKLERQEHLDTLAEFGESIHRRVALESIPFARKQWTQAVSSWSKLRGGELSFNRMCLWAYELFDRDSTLPPS